jgi:hypothetical protein
MSMEWHTAKGGNGRTYRRAIVRCAACDVERIVHAHRAGTFKFCSHGCAKRAHFDALLARWEAKVGEPIGAFLRRRYIENMDSLRELMHDLGLSEVRILQKAMAHFGVPIRSGSAAVKAQWRSADARRRNTATLARRHLVTDGRYAHGRVHSHREDRLADWLSAVGWRIQHQGRVTVRQPCRSRAGRLFRRRSHFYVDLYLPEARLGIEVFSSSTSLRAHRHYVLAEVLGMRMRYIPNRLVDAGNGPWVHQLVADLQRLCVNPAASDHEEPMVGRRPEGAPVLANDFDQQSIEVVDVELDDWTPPARVRANPVAAPHALDR